MNLACRSRAPLASLAAPWRAASLAVSLVMSLSSERALAQLAWHPPERCAEARAALPPVQDQADPPAIEVAVSGTAGHWLATLRVRYANGSGGARRISARSCAELGRAVAVTLSLLDAATEPPVTALASALPAPSAAPLPEPADLPAVSPAPSAASLLEALAPPAPAAVSPAAVPAARAASGREDEPPATSEQVAPHTLAGFVRASSLVALAGSRFGELGAALASGAWLGPWGMQLELSARRPLAKPRTAHDFTLQLERYAVRLEPCARRLGAVELAVCLGPRLELLRGLAVGPSQPASDVVWLPAVGGGSRLRLPVSAVWALSAELQASWSLRRAQASVAPWGKVFELPRTGAGLLLGAEWSL